MARRWHGDTKTMTARSRCRSFASDERGSVLVFVSIMLPVLIGFALLAIDMARVNALHFDLQGGVDALALAGAAELDGTSDAMTRANRAIANLIANGTKFSTAGDHTLQSSDVTVAFLASLPASDSIALLANGTDANGVDRSAANASDAQFVMVTVNANSPTSPFQTIFPASFLGGTDAMTLSAQAVAGFGSGVCDYTPMFICNPYEDTTQTGGVTLEQAVSETRYRRRQILMRSGGNNSAYSPGNFGFLTPPTGNGAKALAQAIASSAPNACYSSEGVTTKTGQNVGPVIGGLNIRFGIELNGGGNAYTGAEYGPAENVRKGALPDTGNPTKCPTDNKIEYGVAATDGVMGPPRDDCFGSGNCTMMGGRMGDGSWDLTNYWLVNHNGAAVPADLWDGTAANKPTRYDVYLYEINNNLVGDLSNAPGRESGTPQSGCGTPIPVTQVDRRLLYGAILNCKALSATYNLGGKDEDLPVEAFASFFLTEPIKNNTDIYAELVDITGRFGQGSMQKFQRDEVQLYR